MPGIGIRNLVNRGTDYAINFIDQFITSSTNIKNSIKIYDPKDSNTEKDDITKNMMLALIRDTYVCNLLLGYTGMMKLLSDDRRFEDIDVKLLKYVDEFYNDNEFKKSLCQIYSKYREEYDSIELGEPVDFERLEFIRFLERIIDRLQIVDKKAAIYSCTNMLENKIYNLINVTPLIALDSKHISGIRSDKRIEISGKKTKQDGRIIVEIPLHYDNYSLLVDHVKDSETRHEIEKKYRSRTHTAMKDFADLIIYRKLFASEMGYPSYFQYVTRDKKDNSEVIKKLIISLNSKIDEQARDEMLNIYNYYNRRLGSENRKKITPGDIRRYVKIHSNTRTYDKYVVMYYLFNLVKKYFGITIKRYDFENDSSTNMKNTDNDAMSEEITFDNFKGFNLLLEKDGINSDSDEILGRLYIDIDKSETKKIIDPISIKVSDRMLISNGMYTMPEVILLANYDREITYLEVVQLFKEFGYVLQELCYKSGVGLVNRDSEFANFMPLLMENIAWDRDTVEMVCQDSDITDHTIAMRHFNICTSLKQKCINAKFDHLLHNSDEIIDILVRIINTNDQSEEQVFESIRDTIVQLYQTIYIESFEGMSDLLDIPEDIALAAIDPLALVQEINGSQGLLYSNLMNEIFAHACYHILKNGIKDGSEFRQVVLEDGVTPFRDLISEFMSVPNLNSFNLYLSELLDIKSSTMSDVKNTEENKYSLTDDNAYDYINTDYDSTFNNFDDRPYIESDIETENDAGSIIRINRI